MTPLDAEDKFKYCYVLVNSEHAKKRKYKLKQPDPPLDDADEDYFDSITQLFCKTTGFNIQAKTGTGTLRAPIMQQYHDSPEVIEATREYDLIMDPYEQ